MRRYKSAIADLYHIEFERSENISNLPQGKYIEPSEAKAYRQNKTASADTEAVLVEKRDRECKHSLSLSCKFEYTALSQTSFGGVFL